MTDRKTHYLMEFRVLQVVQSPGNIVGVWEKTAQCEQHTFDFELLALVEQWTVEYEVGTGREISREFDGRNLLPYILCDGEFVVAATMSNYGGMRFSDGHTGCMEHLVAIRRTSL